MNESTPVKTEVNWSEGASIPQFGRENVLGLSDSELEAARDRGKTLALHYPVTVTGALLPLEPLKSMIDGGEGHPLRKFFANIFRGLSKIQSMDDVYQKLGLHEFPVNSYDLPESIPQPTPGSPPVRMGVSIQTNELGTGFTFSCATCHSASLFGRKVMGLTNRFPRANAFFELGSRSIGFIHPNAFRIMSGATAGETEMFKRTQRNMKWVGSRLPQVLGLDTSLAQLALSLSRREQDAWASKTARAAAWPRPNVLEHAVADSKPGVWWNVKYKNRWLLDGSVVSGNPIFTNILWNEIGRGTDLRELDTWLAENQPLIDDFTAAVFATKAPRYTDFFPAARINIEGAKRGERLFVNHCALCHGVYEKAWNSPQAASLNGTDLLATTRVVYHSQTPVINVGTDPGRARGMAAFSERLNALAISQRNNILIKPQQGYVPPPLVGIWARWPYFHNNSIPSLCAVLTRSENRPVTYISGEANSPTTDFDDTCNGYPKIENVPRSWKNNKEALYDTRREGMGKQGHDEGVFLRNGTELFSDRDKQDIILFLKTL